MGTIHIILMENTLRFREPELIKYIFDLKGSKVDRQVKNKVKNTTTLKDIDFLQTAEYNQGLTCMKKKVRL